MRYDFSLSGVEIFAAGKHNGDDYSTQDLDDIIQAYTQLDYVPVIKAGHGEDKPGMPALGYVRNLRRAGEKLVADFTDMPQVVYDAIRAKRYNTVSSEVWWNLQRGANSFRRALKAVALLGAEIPAVAGLKPLHEMFSAQAEVKYGEATHVASSIDAAIHLHSTEDSTMTEAEKKLAEAQAQIEAERTAREAAERTAKEAQDKLAEYASNKQGQQVQQVLHTLTEAEREAKYAQERTAREQAENAAKAERELREAAERRYAEEKAAREKIEEDRRREQIGAIADRCKIPALRCFVTQYVDLATRQPDAKVYSEKGEQISALAAVEEFVKYVNANSTKLFSVVSSQTRDVTADAGENAADEVDKRTRKYMVDHKVSDYHTAMVAVFTADPGLKTRYVEQFQRAS